MKAVWEGSLSLALLNIPVKLYPAVNPQAFGFRMLHDKDGGELRYKRVCSKCGKEVAWENVVKGFRLPDKYYILTKEKLAKLKPEASQFIEIVGFVDKGMVDILYYDKPYYLAPAQAKEKAYFLFKEVLSETAHIAVGNFIMREREHMCLIESYKKGLLLITLNYPYEIRDINEVPFLKTETPLNKEELKLARELVGKFTLKTLDLSKYKDTFAEKLKELIMMDLRGKKLPAPKKPSKKSLMEALKASVK